MSASGSSSKPVPKWKQLQMAEKERIARLKLQEQEEKLKKLQDLGLTGRSTANDTVVEMEGIPNQAAVDVDTGATLRRAKDKGAVAGVVFMPKAAAKVCSRCIVEFSATRHKFHCGHCGRVLCDTCCSKKRRLPVVGLTLVCVDCLVGIDQAKKAAAGAVNQDVDETNDDDEDDGANAATADDAGDEEAGAAAAAAAAAAAEDAAQAEAEAAEQEAQAEAQQLAAEMAAAAPPPPTIQYPADIGQDVYDVRAHVLRLLQPVGYINGVAIDGFDLEYEYLVEAQRQAGFYPDFSAALHEANLQKNRYSNILPPEHSRVRLSLQNDDPFSDYINANFLDTTVQHRYISCQGPLETTFADFWRMVWETNSCVILMLTREIEKGFIKCDRYWPDPETTSPYDVPTDDGDENNNNNDDDEDDEDDDLAARTRVAARYGDVTVTYLGNEWGDEYMVRRFEIRHADEPNVVRPVTQFQYTGWPDHGIPASRGGFLRLCALADETNVTGAPPIVHCSAGVGRTGTFCTVHGALERFRAELEQGVTPSVNLLLGVLAMRQSRPGMVQTKEQYIFCYLAVLEQTELWLHERGMLPPDPASGEATNEATGDDNNSNDAGENYDEAETLDNSSSNNNSSNHTDSNNNSENNNENELLEAFQNLDTDGSGKLSRDELAAVMANMDSFDTPDKIEAALNQVDVDGDGLIDYAEFCQLAASGFD